MEKDEWSVTNRLFRKQGGSLFHVMSLGRQGPGQNPTSAFYFMAGSSGEVCDHRAVDRTGEPWPLPSSHTQVLSSGSKYNP